MPLSFTQMIRMRCANSINSFVDFISLCSASNKISLKLCTKSFTKVISIVLGSGRAADIVCAACEMTTFKEDFVDG